MRYIAAALLLAQAEQDVTAANIEKILGSVGVEVDKKNLDIVLKNIQGKSMEDLVAEGTKKLASVGGGVAAAPAAGDTESYINIFNFFKNFATWVFG